VKTSTFALAAALSVNTLAAGWALLRSGAHAPAPRPLPSASAEAPAVAATPTTPAAPSFDRDRLDDTAERVQALETTLARLRSDGGASAPPGAHRRTGPMPTPEEDAAQAAQIRQALAAFVSQQSRDAQWAAGYESQLASIAASAKDAAVRENRCYASVCRLELEHASEQSRIPFLQGLQRDVLKPEGGASAMYFEPALGTDGKPATVVHVFRAGYPLPAL